MADHTASGKNVINTRSPADASPGVIVWEGRTNRKKEEFRRCGQLLATRNRYTNKVHFCLFHLYGFKEKAIQPTT